MVPTIKRKYPNRIWLVGGGDLAGQCVNHGLIDEIILTIIPITLGKGIKWISTHNKEKKWSLKESYQMNNGIMQVVYEYP